MIHASFTSKCSWALLVLALALPLPATLAAEQQPDASVETITEAENIPQEAEQGPSTPVPLPPKSVVENAEPSLATSSDTVPRNRFSPSSLGISIREGQDSGILVERVRRGSAAATIGLQPGDRIVSVAQISVANADQLSDAIETSLSKGSREEHVRVPLGVRRGEVEHPVYLTNDTLARAGFGPLLIDYGYYVPPEYSTGYRGLGLEGQRGHSERAYLGIQLNAQFPSAAIVSRVLPDTPAARAGLQEGDRIWAINNRPIGSASDLVFIVGQLEPDETVELQFDRSHSVSITLGPNTARPEGNPPEAVGAKNDSAASEE